MFFFRFWRLEFIILCLNFSTQYKSDKEKSQFLTFVLFLPFLAIIPIFLIGIIGYNPIATFLSKENPIVYDYVWQIPIIGLCMGLF